MGLTVVAAGAIIGLLDPSDTHHASATRAISEASARRDQLVIPASAYAECLVGPSRQGPTVVDHVRMFAEQLPLHIAALDRSIAEAAAGLRARHGGRMKLPDALVVATAIVVGADLLITTDRGWPSRRSLGLGGRLLVL